VDAVEFADINFLVHSEQQNNIQWNGTIEMHNIKIDSLPGLSTDFLPKIFKCTLNDFSYFIAESHHFIQIKKLTIDSRQSNAILDSVTCRPEYNKFEHGKKLGHQSDRI